MHQIIFVGSPEAVADMEMGESPAENFPCMSSQQFHREARAQLYALVMGTFLHEALELEQLAQSLTSDGPYVYHLAPELQKNIAYLEEDAVEALAEAWMACEEIEQLDLDANDLHEFMFSYIHFCQVAQNDDLVIYIYSDD